MKEWDEPAQLEFITPADFWPWAFSDFLSNALRGVLAEYIVACAVGCTGRGRTEWDAYDLKTETNLKLEVKSAAYLQSWIQTRHSTIRFDIAPKKGWDAQTNIRASTATRAADLYVFCLFTATDRASANPLQLSQWVFLVCRTEWINRHLGVQKSVALSKLGALGLERVAFSQLNTQILRLASNGME